MPNYYLPNLVNDFTGNNTLNLPNLLRRLLESRVFTSKETEYTEYIPRSIHNTPKGRRLENAEIISYLEKTLANRPSTPDSVAHEANRYITALQAENEANRIILGGRKSSLFFTKNNFSDLLPVMSPLAIPSKMTDRSHATYRYGRDIFGADLPARIILNPRLKAPVTTLSSTILHELTHNYQRSAGIVDYSSEVPIAKEIVNSHYANLGISLNQHDQDWFSNYFLNNEEIQARDWALYLTEGRTVFPRSKIEIEKAISSGRITKDDLNRIKRLVKGLNKIAISGSLRRNKLMSQGFTGETEYLTEGIRGFNPPYRFFSRGDTRGLYPNPGLLNKLMQGPTFGFAKGGKLQRGSIGIVGEKGPEVIRVDSDGVSITPISDKMSNQLLSRGVMGFAEGTGDTNLAEYLYNILSGGGIDIKLKNALAAQSKEKLLELKNKVVSGASSESIRAELGLVAQAVAARPKTTASYTSAGGTTLSPEQRAAQKFAAVYDPLIKTSGNATILSNLYGQQMGIAPEQRQGLEAKNLTKFQRISDVAKGIDELQMEFKNAAGAVVKLRVAIDKQTGKIMQTKSGEVIYMEQVEEAASKEKAQARRDASNKRLSRRIAKEQKSTYGLWAGLPLDEEQRGILQEAVGPTEQINFAKSRFSAPSTDQYGTTTLKARIVDLTGAHKDLSLVIDKEGKIVRDTNGQILKRADAQRYMASQQRGEIWQQQTQSDFDRQMSQAEALNQKLGKSLKEKVSAIDPRFLTDPSRQLSVSSRAQGYKDYNFKFTDEYGTVQKATMVVDKYNTVIDKASRRTMNFTDSIMRNMGEFFKWTLALSVVYMPMQKLTELYNKMVENQTRLAQTIVTLGVSQTLTNKIFEDATKIAADTGTALEGVLEGYNLAFRAVGNLTDGSEKFAVANKLMFDSITLSKLGMISQSEATDVLVAALKQSEMSLTDGSVLLDKWVTVSRNANVDVNTLATSFAIVGEAAKQAGLSVDELNGIIATVAAKTITSAKETGNAVRALVSGYSSDASAKELMKFGIAVTDTQNRARGMMDVFSDIEQAVRSGRMSSTQLNQLALTIGGGNRRQAQAVLSIMGVEESQNVAEISKNYQQGAAQRALDIMVDTIQGDLNKVTVEFSKLAQVLGTDGGLLSGVEDVLDIFLALSKVLTSVTGSLGSATTALSAMGLAWLALGKGNGRFGQGLGSIFGGIAGFVGGGIDAVRSPFVSGITKNAIGSSKVLSPVNIENEMVGISNSQTVQKAGMTMAESFSLNTRSFMSRWAPMIGASMAIGFMAYTRAKEGDLEGMGRIIGGGLVGAGAGYLIGSALGSTLGPMGAAIGSTIGSTIGEAISESIQKEKERIATAATAVYSASKATPVTFGEQKYYKNIAEVRGEASKGTTTGIQYNELYARASLGEEGFKKANDAARKEASDYLAAQVARVSQEYATYMGSQENFDANGRQAFSVYDILAKILAAPTVKGENTISLGNFKTSVTPYLASQSAVKATGLWGNYGNKAITSLPPTSGMSEEAIKSLLLSTTQTSEIDLSEYSKKINSFGKLNQTLFDKILTSQLESIKKEYESGKLTTRGVREAREFARGAMVQISEMGAPFDYNPQEVGLGNTQQLMEFLARINVKGTEDEKALLTSMSSDLKDRYKKIEEAGRLDQTEVTDITGQKFDLTKYKEDTETLKREYVEALIATGKEITYRTPISSTIDLTKEGYGRNTIESVIEDARNSMVKQYEEMFKQAPDQADSFKNANLKDEFWVVYSDGTRILYTGVSPNLVTEQISAAKSSGKLKPMDLTNWGITKAQYESQFNTIYGQVESEIKTLNPEFQFNPESMLVYTKDNALLEVNHKDSRVINETLRRIEEINQKQLDGMFNLPEGASFYIPFQAAGMHKNTVSNIPVTSSATTYSGKEIEQFRKFEELQNRLNDLRKAFDADEAGKFKDTTTNDYTKGWAEGKIEQYNKGMYPETTDRLASLRRAYEADEQGRYQESNYGPQLVDFLRNIFPSLNDFLDPTKLLSPQNQGAMNRTTTQKLDFNIDNRIQLVVNGRVLAEVIKPYLFSSLLQFGSSSTSSLSASGSLIGI